MLGTLPKDFSQVATSQEYFPKWKLPNCAISQAATSQVCPSRSVRPPPPIAELWQKLNSFINDFHP